jgi:hypothetical protein
MGPRNAVGLAGTVPTDAGGVADPGALAESADRAAAYVSARCRGWTRAGGGAALLDHTAALG